MLPPPPELSSRVLAAESPSLLDAVLHFVSKNWDNILLFFALSFLVQRALNISAEVVETRNNKSKRRRQRRAPAVIRAGNDGELAELENERLWLKMIGYTREHWILAIPLSLVPVMVVVLDLSKWQAVFAGAVIFLALTLGLRALARRRLRAVESKIARAHLDALAMEALDRELGLAGNTPVQARVASPPSNETEAEAEEEAVEYDARSTRRKVRR